MKGTKSEDSSVKCSSSATGIPTYRAKGVHGRMNLKKMKVALALVLTAVLVGAQTHVVFPAELAGRDKALSFIRDVIQLDETKYNMTLARYNYHMEEVEERIKYSFDSENSKLDVNSVFINNTLWYCTLDEGEGYVGSALYAQPLPGNVLDAAKNLLQRYQAFSGASYLQAMLDLLNTVDKASELTKTVGNVTLEIKTFDHIQFSWFYTFEGGIVTKTKRVAVGLTQDGGFSVLADTWNKYSIGNTSVKLTREEAITIALKRVESYSYKVGYADGTIGEVNTQVSNIDLNSTKAELYMYKKESSTLYPAWRIQFDFNTWGPANTYGILVQIDAATGEVFYCQNLGVGGPPQTGPTDFSTMEPSQTPQQSPTPQPDELPVSPPEDSEQTPALTQPSGFLGSSFPTEYGYTIVAVTVAAVAVATGYLRLKRKRK